MFNHVPHSSKYRSIKAINDLKVLKEIKRINRTINIEKILNNQKIQNNFIKTFSRWIGSSKINKLKSLDNFKYRTFTNGTSQSFDNFYLKHKYKRFRIFKGEYAYHPITWKNLKFKWKYLEEETLKKNDALIISMPFSDLGGKHPKMETVLKKAEKLNIPTLIDCCYFGICRNINFNFNYKCIEAITFGLSKVFPISNLRVGLRFTKEDFDDSIFVYDKFNYTNRLSQYISLQLIKKFNIDYIFNKYKKKQMIICKKLNIKPSDTVILALGDNKWKVYNRGSKWNRLCISSELTTN